MATFTISKKTGYRISQCEMGCGKNVIWPIWVSNDDILSDNYTSHTCWWCVTPLEEIEAAPDIIKQFATGIPGQMTLYGRTGRGSRGRVQTVPYGDAFATLI